MTIDPLEVQGRVLTRTTSIGHDSWSHLAGMTRELVGIILIYCFP